MISLKLKEIKQKNKKPSQLNSCHLLNLSKTLEKHPYKRRKTEYHRIYHFHHPLPSRENLHSYWLGIMREKIQEIKNKTNKKKKEKFIITPQYLSSHHLMFWNMLWRRVWRGNEKNQILNVRYHLRLCDINKIFRFFVLVFGTSLAR